MEYDRSKASAIGAEEIVIDGSPILVASLADIIRSKRAANRPRDRAVIDVLEKLLKPRISRAARLAAVGRENERALRDMIRRWQALPPGRRTNFLRKRVGYRMTAA